jgi:enterochelin esterase-like enzyme
MRTSPARRSLGRRAAPFLGVALLALGCAPAPPARASSAGHVEEVSFKEPLFGRTRRIWVYTPPGYGAAGDSAGLLVTFDGPQYLEEIPLPHMLDSLTAGGQIAPLVAVLIDNGTAGPRREDLANRAEFATWLSDRLVPWVQQRWKVSRDPRRVILNGSSAGGLAAAYAAFRRPDLFGNVISQSGAFWRGNENSNGAPYEWLTSQFAGAPRKPVRFYLDVGAAETNGTLGGTAPSILSANRRLRDALRAKGYDVTYKEVIGGVHSPESWSARLPAGLTAIAPVQRPRD